MDEISTGLDSSTTFQIVKFLKQLVHVMDVTMIISLLQPAPETFNLFDDIILLSEGHIVYQGPRESVLNFFESVGFKCPERKGVADFLQEVTSRKDQEQYWFARDKPYHYVSVPEFVAHFNNFAIGQQLSQELQVPYDRAKTHPAALVKDKYGLSKLELLKACFAREWLLMKRSAFLYIFKTTQITIMSLITMTVFFRTQMKSGHLEDGVKYYGALFFSLTNIMFNGMAELAMTIFRLPVFFKQRDSLFYPAWAFALPIWIFRIPLSIVESGLWVVLTYYTVGYAPAASRYENMLIHVKESTFPEVYDLLSICVLEKSKLHQLLQIFWSVLSICLRPSNGYLTVPIHCCSWENTGCGKHVWFLCTATCLCSWWVHHCQR